MASHLTTPLIPLYTYPHLYSGVPSQDIVCFCSGIVVQDRSIGIENSLLAGMKCTQGDSRRKLEYQETVHRETTRTRKVHTEITPESTQVMRRQS